MIRSPCLQFSKRFKMMKKHVNYIKLYIIELEMAMLLSLHMVFSLDSAHFAFAVFNACPMQRAVSDDLLCFE